MKKIVGFLFVLLLTGCAQDFREGIEGGPAPGIEYRNQLTAPWPWVSIVPSERALAFRNVSFEDIAKQIHFDLAFEPHYVIFQDVQLIVLDYAILPPLIKTKKRNFERPARYFMTASFYKAGNGPPCPPDIEISTTLRTHKAAPFEAMLYMARDIIEEISTLDRAGDLTPGKKIVVDLD